MSCELRVASCERGTARGERIAAEASKKLENVADALTCWIAAVSAAKEF